MAENILVAKYAPQLKALSPNYDEQISLDDSEPIEFEDSENVLMAFACIADTHLVNKEVCASNLNNFFLDIGNSKEAVDAFLMAGDISEYGTKGEYDRFFSVLDKQKVIPHAFITMGNHDVRLLFKRNQRIIMDKVNQYLNTDTKGKSYYSYDVKGYTFIVIGTDKRVFERAYISPQQIEFLDKELARATAEGKPAFVMCHQAMSNTHGLPEVWKGGDIGAQSQQVREVIEKYKNVLYINGHLHGGIFEKTFETINEERCIYSISIPGYRKLNNFGNKDCGIGYYCCVYKDKLVLKARNFARGKNVEGEYTRFEIILK